MPTHQQNFLLSIRSSVEAKTLYEQIVENFSDSENVEIHFTGTHGGDLRVRTKNRAGKEKNVFTMYWQTRYKRFFCRANHHQQNLEKVRSFANVRKPRTEGEPLKSEFHYTPGNKNNLFLELIKVAIADWQDQ